MISALNLIWIVPVCIIGGMIFAALLEAGR